MAVDSQARSPNLSLFHDVFKSLSSIKHLPFLVALLNPAKRMRWLRVRTLDLVTSSLLRFTEMSAEAKL